MEHGNPPPTLEYGTPQSRRGPWMLLRIARAMVLLPLFFGVLATLGFWMTDAFLFQYAAVLAAMVAVADLAVVPVLVCIAERMTKQMALPLDDVQKHISITLLILLLTYAVGVACMVLTAARFN